MREVEDTSLDRRGRSSTAQRSWWRWPSPAPRSPRPGTTVRSKHGLYRVTVTPRPETSSVGRLHTRRLLLRTAGGAFKPPSLRNVTRSAPYMHAGQLATLGAVLRHYDGAPRAAVGRSELRPLGFGAAQLKALGAFLSTLESKTSGG